MRSFHAAPDAKRVHLVTGERWTPPKARKLRERDRAIAASDVPKVDAAKRIVAYLNALNSNLFAARVGANMESAVEVAAAIDDKRRRGIELTKLHRIAAQPQPFYGPPKDAHTVRVFAKNTSILSLKNEVKAALIHGWRTFDLKSAQVAIVAKDWGMTKLHAWLSTPGNDIWKYLCGQHSGIDPTLLKPVLKKSVYSACYGMDKDTLIAELRGELIGLGEASQSALLSATMFANEAAFVAPLFEHREVMRERIKQDRGATDCFGQRIATSREVRPHAILSMLAQAREMQLLLPAIDLAVERKREFKIVLWEHDGFSVHFTKADRVDRESKRIIDAVNAECNRLGYPTRLERKDHQPVSPPLVDPGSAFHACQCGTTAPRLICSAFSFSAIRSSLTKSPGRMNFASSPGTLTRTQYQSFSFLFTMNSSRDGASNMFLVSTRVSSNLIR